MSAPCSAVKRPLRTRSGIKGSSVLSIGMLLSLEFLVAAGFVPPQPIRQHLPLMTRPTTTTSLSVWSFGGSETMDTDADSCELVPVRIERTSANSRRIFGESTVPVPLADVWAILTDYDNLATHVPNLVDSRINSRLSGGEQGDGQFRCRLFQRGAQKVFGFEFGASVTMDMREVIVAPSASLLPPAARSAVPQAGERRIIFKCYDSFFFSEFDGEWKAQERMNAETGQMETLLSYVVDVRPKGPVPVAALEWRIKEDVPTNLRSVKRAALVVGYKGVLASRGIDVAAAARNSDILPVAASAANSASSTEKKRKGGLLARVNVKWYKDETMAAYLSD